MNERSKNIAIDESPMNIKVNQEELNNSLPYALQTPLSAVIGFTDYLIEDYQKIERDVLLEVALNIKDSAGRLNSYIQKILTIANIETLLHDKSRIRMSGKHSTYITNELIKEAAVKKAVTFGRGTDIEVYMDPVYLKISKEHLTKLIEEITENSLKFSEHNSKIQINGRQYGSEYLLYFRDSGRGMTTEKIQQIEEYLKIKKIIYEQRNTGLGLLIVKKILDIYGGELTIESIPSKQTLVSAKLPVS